MLVAVTTAVAGSSPGWSPGVPGQISPGGWVRAHRLPRRRPARAIVSVAPERQEALLDLCAEHELPAARIGEVTQAAELAVEGLFTLPLSRIREVWRDTVPDAMQGV